MSGRMIRLKLEERLKLLNRVRWMAGAFLGKPKLKAEGVHTGINLLGLLEGLDRLLRLVLAQVSATHNVVGCRIVWVQINRPLAFFGRALASAGKQQGVGQV